MRIADLISKFHYLEEPLLLWVEEPSEKGLQSHNLLKSFYNSFNEEGTITFPQLDVQFAPG